MLITDRPAADVDALRSPPPRRGLRPGGRRLRRGAPRRGTSPSISAPPPSRSRVTDADVDRDRRLRPRAGPARRAPGARPRRRRARLARAHDPDLHQAHARRADRPGRPPRPRARRRASGTTSPAPPSAYGLAPLAGTAGDVGVVGYTLGGGLSWLGRAHGLACNSVTAIELVTADGRLDPHRRAQRPGAVLGAARRRPRHFGDRHRAGVRALPGRGSSTAAR